MEDNTVEISWEYLSELVDKLARDISASDWKPDSLVGITSGGLIPLALISKKLGVTDIMTISATSYTEDEKGALTISNVPAVCLKDRSVLLIDEIADTGDTFREVIRTLRTQCSADVLKSAAIAVRTDKCKTRPDFFALEVDRWVTFPWD
ncbi:hypothetical protein HY971_04360 [Candidatus Kaiserbacteria bacterium]|nr:hypothetical protein [Candidatus Kaiserbacteria bacterium]